MIHEIDRIKQGIEECKSKGDMMPMPNLEGEGFSIKETLLKPIGTILYRRKYKIDYDNGDWIQIEYNSRRNGLLSLNNPHRSEVKVTCSDPSLNFTDEWDEKA